MVSLFAFFGPPVVTLLAFVLGVLPYASWVKRRKPSRSARWAVVGGAAALAAYGAGTVYGLAFTDPLGTCASPTGDGVYLDTLRDSRLTSVDVDSFPPSLTCHWADGHDTEAAPFWAAPLLYAGLACAVGCSALLLAGRHRSRRRGPERDHSPRDPDRQRGRAGWVGEGRQRRSGCPAPRLRRERPPGRRA
ncbi:hypothetical protein ACIQOU_22325 [Streptomyces sp. NPDC091279]|uniref:hypothetical protein n=1 Tax=Streptomyces sp. NPDC091279 TaxID=3365983 RepID=UPI003809D922